jgi:RNA polymerase sigma-70 factor, ECF subfamily
VGRATRIARVDAAEVSLVAPWRPARRAGDAALVRAAQRGSEAAVEALFARHWPDAYRTALLITHDRAAAEDIAQEAFLAALRALPRFDRRRPVRPWLHRIVVNRAIDWTRARRLRQEVDAAAAP